MSSSTFRRLPLLALLVIACKSVPIADETPVADAPSAAPMPGELLGPERFAGIADPAARSKALFVEAGKVLTHARCTNCHPAGDSPLQGNPGRLHEPPVVRGAGGHGTFVNACHSCHQAANNPDAPVPGAPLWHLAPASMAWHGAPLGKLCAQLKDSSRNGSRTLEQIVEHSTHDPLVGWGWAPGPGRTPAPGTQERFGALLAAWAASGAACPD